MLERAIATHNAHDYEKDDRFLIIGPILVTLSVVLSVAMSFSYNIRKSANSKL
jgi:hypothetical protein